MKIKRFVDMHVHFRDPGFTQKETLETGLAAARAGGFGAVVAMANTKPVISSLEAALSNMERAKKLQEGLKNPVRLIQAVSITEGFDGKSIDHLRTLDKSVTPVISEDGKDVADEKVMEAAMSIAAEKGLIVACHCEDAALAKKAAIQREKFLMETEDACPTFKNAFVAFCKGECSKRVKLEGFWQSFNWHIITSYLKKANKILREAEDKATLRNIEIAKRTGCKLHLCHVSTKRSIDLARKAKKEGLSLTVEVTPHHLAPAWGNLIMALVNPPLREFFDVEAIFEGIKDGTVDCISSDHAPHTFEDKLAGAPGFVGLETSFSVVNTMLKEHKLPFDKLQALMTQNPAKILGINIEELGEIEVNESEEVKIDSTKFFSKSHASIFGGCYFQGKVIG